MSEDGKIKIVSDEGWKEQAQKEKEKLTDAAGGESAVVDDSTKQEAGGVPPASFLTLINSIMIQALYSLGCLGMEGQETPAVNLELAKYHIDTLQMLEEKTRGNLTPEESRAMSVALHELRMQYVQVAQSV